MLWGHYVLQINFYSEGSAMYMVYNILNLQSDRYVLHFHLNKLSGQDQWFHSWLEIRIEVRGRPRGSHGTLDTTP